MFIELIGGRATYDSGRSRTQYFDFIFYKHTTSPRSFQKKCNLILKLSALKFDSKVEGTYYQGNLTLSGPLDTDRLAYRIFQRL